MFVDGGEGAAAEQVDGASPGQLGNLDRHRAGRGREVGDAQEALPLRRRGVVAARVRQDGVIAGGAQEEVPATQHGMGAAQVQDPPGELQQRVGPGHLSGHRQVRVAGGLDERKRQGARVDH